MWASVLSLEAAGAPSTSRTDEGALPTGSWSMCTNRSTGWPSSTPGARLTANSLRWAQVLNFQRRKDRGHEGLRQASSRTPCSWWRLPLSPLSFCLRRCYSGGLRGFELGRGRGLHPLGERRAFIEEGAGGRPVRDEQENGGAEMVKEARLAAVDSGLAPLTEGWFVVNARDAAWLTNDAFGARCIFEANGPVLRRRPDLDRQTFPGPRSHARCDLARAAQWAVPRGDESGGLPRSDGGMRPARRG